MENYIIKAEELEQIKGLLPAIVYNELSRYTEQSQEIAEEIVEEVAHEDTPAVIEAIAETLADFTADDYRNAIETYNTILEYAEGEEKEQAQEALELAEMMLESMGESYGIGGLLKKAYKKAAPHVSSAIKKSKEVAKEGYHKGKKAVNDKIHSEKKKIALNVIDATIDKTDDSDARRHLAAAEELVEVNFKNGGIVCPEGTKLQSLVFTKDKFTKLKARAWAKKHDFKFAGVDVTKTQYRLRQESPSKFKKETFRTINVTDGIQGIVACPVN
mgnify:CR=1 FL=1